jgi:hypothetical protein
MALAICARRCPFSHREHDIYLVTRIDAFAVEQDERQRSLIFK